MKRDGIGKFPTCEGKFGKCISTISQNGPYVYSSVMRDMWEDESEIDGDTKSCDDGDAQ